MAPKNASPPYTTINPIPAIKEALIVRLATSFLSLYPLLLNDAIIKATTPPIPKASIV